MNWNWKLTRIAGTDVNIHLTFWLLLGGVALMGLMSGGAVAAFGYVAFVVLLFACVLAHEVGHICAARFFGVRTPVVTLYPIGGVARLERMPERPYQELIVALAGPAVNVVIAGLLMLLVGVGATFGTNSGSSFLGYLATVNLTLALFNLIPAFPMDGGRVLRAILAMKMRYVDATRTAAMVGRGAAILMGVIGLFGYPMLTLIAVFIYFAAGQELRAVESRSSGGVPGKPASGSPIIDENGEVVDRVDPNRRTARWGFEQR
jgi:stage IV sporulation protein FB